MPHPFALSAVLLLLATATIVDARTNRIPNKLCLAGALAGLLVHLALSGPVGGVVALGGAAVGLAVFLPFYAVGGMGAGDVKLMAVVGLYLGPESALLAAGCSLLAGSVVALAILLRHGELASTLARYALLVKTLLISRTWLYEPPRPGEAAATRFPYAIAIAAGTVVAVWLLSRWPELRPW